MKVVILAGGFGTRLSEETKDIPKPMVEIGGKPILWHIMKIYSHYGFNEFIICLGYKGHVIKEYFKNYFLHNSDMTIDLSDNSSTIHNNTSEPWKITLVDTGLNTKTGGRIKRIKQYLNNEPFMLTYGDGVSDVDINKLLKFHNANKKLVTVTAVNPEARFGSLKIEGNLVTNFSEKTDNIDIWINGGFFVINPEFIDYIEDDSTIFEYGPLEQIAQEKKLAAYKHLGFWKPMDKLADKKMLDDMWLNNNAPWKIW